MAVSPDMEATLTYVEDDSEVAPPKHRGRYVVLNHVGFVAGLASGFWYVSFVEG